MSTRRELRSPTPPAVKPSFLVVSHVAAALPNSEKTWDVVWPSVREQLQARPIDVTALAACKEELETAVWREKLPSAAPPDDPPSRLSFGSIPGVWGWSYESGCP